ncbi:unnamed protein product [Victoria cruziana]
MFTPFPGCRRVQGSRLPLLQFCFTSTNRAIANLVCWWHGRGLEVSLEEFSPFFIMYTSSEVSSNLSLGSGEHTEVPHLHHGIGEISSESGEVTAVQ